MVYAAVTPLMAALAGLLLFPDDMVSAVTAASAAQPLFLLAGSLLAFWRSGIGFPRAASPVSGGLSGMACAVLMWPGAAVLSALFSAPSGEPSAMAETIRGFGFVPASLLLAFLPAVCEEIYARGFLYGVLSRYGASAGIAGSAVCFALLHGSAGQAAYALYCGLMLGMLRHVSGSVVPGIVGHFLFNLSSVTLAFFPAGTGSSISPIPLSIIAVLFTTAFFVCCAVTSRRRAHTDPDRPSIHTVWLLAGAAASAMISCILH